MSIFLFLQSIIVYGLIVWVMTYCGDIAYRQQYPNGFLGGDVLSNREISFGSMLIKSYYAIPVFVFSFFAAIRYKVGVDCESYKQIYYQILYYNGNNLIASDIEEGFTLLAQLIGTFAESHYLFMFVLAFLQISFMYYAFRKHTNILCYLGLSIFLTGLYWSFMNGIRQNIVACAFVALLPLALNKKWMYFAIGIIIASYMHRSALILLPIGIVLYFTPNKIPGVKLQLVIVAISFLLMDKFEGVLNIFSDYAVLIGYSEKVTDVYINNENRTLTFGFRMWMLYFSYIIAIIYSEKMNSLFNSRSFTICYNLFFVGICLKLVFYNNFTINRLLYYFAIFVPVIVSALFFYLCKNKRHNMFITVLMFLLFRTFYEWYTESQNNILNETFLYKFDV